MYRISGYRRIAETGSTRDARIAGKRLPANSNAMAAAIATANVQPSPGETPAAAPASRDRRVRERAARHDANQHQDRGFARDHRENRARRGAKRDAHADLLRALRDRERQQAVNADGREQEREHGKRRDHAELHAARRRLERDDLIHRPHVGDRLLRIDAANDLADRCGERRWIAAGYVHGEIVREVPDQRSVADLPVGRIHLRLARPLESADFHIPDDTDDDALGERERERVSNRIASGHNRCASDSLTIAAAWRSAVSDALKSRPRRSGIAIVLKYSGVTNRRLAVSPPPRIVAWPFNVTGQMPPPRTSGRPPM